MAKQSPAAIYVTDLSTDNLEELANTIQSKYPSVKCFARKVDAASDEDVKSVIEEAMKSFGRLDVFFANAGVASGTHIKDETSESFMRMMKINALRYFCKRDRLLYRISKLMFGMSSYSAFLAIKYASAAMQVTGKGGKEHSGGSIIATASGMSCEVSCAVDNLLLTTCCTIVAGIRSGAGSSEYSASKAAYVLCNIVITEWNIAN
jgi:NAD(P)-dependent dehydrogenase (short-subunit alcohol dehydrogenase family)